MGLFADGTEMNQQIVNHKVLAHRTLIIEFESIVAIFSHNHRVEVSWGILSTRILCQHLQTNGTLDGKRFGYVSCCSFHCVARSVFVAMASSVASSLDCELQRPAVVLLEECKPTMKTRSKT